MVRKNIPKEMGNGKITDMEIAAFLVANTNRSASSLIHRLSIKCMGLYEAYEMHELCGL